MAHRIKGPGQVQCYRLLNHYLSYESTFRTHQVSHIPLCTLGGIRAGALKADCVFQNNLAL